MSEQIYWGKLNPLLAWKTFQDLREKRQLSLEDCRGCKLTLQNTHLNILDGIVNKFDYDIQWIENKMSEIEVVIIEIENNIGAFCENLDSEKVDPGNCERCTMKSELCQFKHCHECCRQTDCLTHGIVDNQTDPNYWKDNLSDDDDWADQPICQKCRRESAQLHCQRNFCQECCNGVCLGCFSVKQKEEKLEREMTERAELLGITIHNNKVYKRVDQTTPVDSKESWANSLFGVEEKEVLECSVCGNQDLYDCGQWKNYCYVCRKNAE